MKCASVTNEQSTSTIPTVTVAADEKPKSNTPLSEVEDNIIDLLVTTVRTTLVYNTSSKNMHTETVAENDMWQKGTTF